jgi:hypothetical protein
MIILVGRRAGQLRSVSKVLDRRRYGGNRFIALSRLFLPLAKH